MASKLEKMERSCKAWDLELGAYFSKPPSADSLAERLNSLHMHHMQTLLSAVLQQGFQSS